MSNAVWKSCFASLSCFCSLRAFLLSADNARRMLIRSGADTVVTRLVGGAFVETGRLPLRAGAGRLVRRY